MHFFATLTCALCASLSVVSATHIQGRNALRLAQGLPPLPPRRATRTDSARRDLPSGISTPLLFDGDFETDSVSPWVYSPEARLSDDPTLRRSSSHCSLIQPVQQYATGYFTHPMSLIPLTDYTVTFYERFQKNTADNVVECIYHFHIGDNVHPDVAIWTSPAAEPSDAFIQRTIAFSTSRISSYDMYFGLICSSENTGTWLIDDVSLTMATPTDTPNRK
ncbi:hypothetical protein DL96DRAFT_1256843 [Flagelloscypha sp. PMI_526]|nr:hypothetical protein DL96DRAFT_1256843 [Flagelloscypha sp. PMI_526]